MDIAGEFRHGTVSTTESFTFSSSKIVKILWCFFCPSEWLLQLHGLVRPIAIFFLNCITHKLWYLLHINLSFIYLWSLINYQILYVVPNIYFLIFLFVINVCFIIFVLETLFSITLFHCLKHYLNRFQDQKQNNNFIGVNIFLSDLKKVL